MQWKKRITLPVLAEGPQVDLEGLGHPARWHHLDLDVDRHGHLVSPAEEVRRLLMELLAEELR